MLNSSKFLNKALLALLTITSFSLYCAQPAAAPGGSPDVLVDNAGEALKQLANTEASLAGLSPSASLETMLPRLKIFAIQFNKALASSDAETKEYLNTMANDDLNNIAAFPALKAKLGRLNSNFELINFLANPDIVIVNDEASGRNQLSYAGYENKPEKVKILLALGANPNYKDLHGYTALKYAESHNNPSYRETIDLLKAVTAQS